MLRLVPALCLLAAACSPTVRWARPADTLPSGHAPGAQHRLLYRVSMVPEQVEVLSLSGDIGAGANGAPAVHVHCALQGKDGPARGGHLIDATTSPTLEVFVTTFPQPLPKKLDPTYDLQLFDPGASAPAPPAAN